MRHFYFHIFALKETKPLGPPRVLWPEVKAHVDSHVASCLWLSTLASARNLFTTSSSPVKDLVSFPIAPRHSHQVVVHCRLHWTSEQYRRRIQSAFEMKSDFYSVRYILPSVFREFSFTSCSLNSGRLSSLLEPTPIVPSAVFQNLLSPGNLTPPPHLHIYPWKMKTSLTCSYS